MEALCGRTQGVGGDSGSDGGIVHGHAALRRCENRWVLDCTRARMSRPVSARHPARLDGASRLSSLPLYWRVFASNAALLFLAFLGLVFAPVTVSVPPELTELIVLIAGLIVILAIDLIVLRPVFRPLDEVVETMRRHDPLSPGRRARVDGDPALPPSRRRSTRCLIGSSPNGGESAHQALMVQEAERARIARELHDEVGQTLTGVMLQVEGLAAVIPEELREQLDELRETARDGTEEVRRIARRLRPEALEDLGLQSALSALATRVADQAHLDIVPSTSTPA